MHKHHLLDVDINRLKATDLLKFYDLRFHHRKNPLTDYLNISSLRNKISDLSVFLITDYATCNFIVSETKLESTFPSALFALENCDIRVRKGPRWERGKA